MDIFLRLLFLIYFYHFNRVRVGTVILENHFSASYMKIFCKKHEKQYTYLFLDMTLYFVLKCYSILDHLSHCFDLWYTHKKRLKMVSLCSLQCMFIWLITLKPTGSSACPLLLFWTCKKGLLRTGCVTPPVLLTNLISIALNLISKALNVSSCR